MSHRLRTAWALSTPLLLLAILVVIDPVLERLEQEHGPVVYPTGVVDEAGHLATGLILIAPFTFARAGTAFLIAALGVSVLLDIDHVPLAAFDWAGLTAGTPRPYPHSLTTVAVALVAAAVWKSTVHPKRRAVAFGIALGVSVHLLRDLGTGGGVALFWPLTDRSFSWTHVGYAAVLAVATGLTVLLHALGSPGRRL